MDPQSVAFVPHNDSWRLQNELLRVQQIQADHTDRLIRLERRQEDDARMKSVWGGASPFPSVLSGTPQQAALHHPPSDHFKDFDDEANLIGSLHLDADDEPRRMGATSRANSVRFDESANQGHWSHASRSSMDFLPRSTSSLGGIAMNERTSSHKSDGRASSVHSVRSAASGRASSLNLDTAYALPDTLRSSPLDTPGLAPGLLLLGSVPAIIRCWMNTDFKHNALLYAAICSASHKSHVDLRLLRKLGFEDRIVDTSSGGRTIDLPVYFPEAVPHPTSSRPSSPAPQVPTLTVEFNVVDGGTNEKEARSIQVFIGSDTLRLHNADVMFSTNSVCLYDDEQCRLSIPLVRPEDETVFNSLQTTGRGLQSASNAGRSEQAAEQEYTSLNGLRQKQAYNSEPTSVDTPLSAKYRAPGVIAAESRTSSSRDSHGNAPPPEDETSAGATGGRQNSLGSNNTLTENKENAAETGSPNVTAAQGAPATWGSWRRDTPSQITQSEWSGSNKNQDSGYQRRDTGIKVLKPMKTSSRTISTSASSPSTSEGKSRFFDEGKRRGALESMQSAGMERRTSAAPPSLSRKSSSSARENQAPAGVGIETVTKTRTNPVGGASAFSWLNSGGSKS
ncbi:hypothetical protein AAFC00_004017 [Neodothiora populina]|uniref:Ubiquitin carboxyl-terminal hydrolase 19 n=1 Tax=Neodothiora populina TaxID=2781224 RepID=A0ABR3PI92_9PEZI